MTEQGLPVNQIVCSDVMDYLRGLPDDSVHCVVTDPPYGCGTQVSAWRSPDERFDEIEGINEISGEWIPEAYRILKSGGAIYCFAKWRNVGQWIGLFETVGFIIKNTLIWDKLQHGTGDLNGSYAPQYEMIIFATKGKHDLRTVRRPDIIRYPKVQPNDLVHPYEKPTGLLSIFVEASTELNDIILDPFMGSGTTAIVARRLGRNFMGCDLSSEYVEMANRRLALPFTPPLFQL